jgi:hypothetical protein
MAAGGGSFVGFLPLAFLELSAPWLCGFAHPIKSSLAR